MAVTGVIGAPHSTVSIEPSPPGPSFIGERISALCSVLARPVLITGVLRDILIRHFAFPQNIEEPDLRALIWQKGETSPILIESIHRWDPRATERRPAVIIKRNSYTNQRIGIGDKLQTPPADRIGDAHYSTLWAGSHTLFCIGGTGAQAELLSSEIQRELHEFGPILASTLQLKRFLVAEVGAVAEIEEAKEQFVVPVVASYAYQETWVLRQQAPTLQKISFSPTFLEC